ncbi:MAG: hypothetical protein ACU0FH_16780 [Heliomarina sp.]|uniref:hypothetical protein n=1 Tax=Heliomarina sp. TaxID=2917556 RepID=UPI00405833CE
MTDSANTTALTPSERLAQRKAEVSDVIERQHLARAAATLDETVFDPSLLRSAENEMEGIVDAEQEVVRRERAEVAEKAQRARNADAKRALKLLKDWSASINEMELSSRAAVDASVKAEALRKELADLLHNLVDSVPTLLFQKEQETRRSRSLSALLSKSVQDGVYGELRLRPGAVLAEDPWSDAEKALGATLEPQLKGIING